MLNRALVLLLSAGLMMSTGGCTSKKAAEEEAPADVAEVAGEGDSSAGEGDDIMAADDTVSELGSDELSADEKLPEEGGADGTATAEAGGDDFAAPGGELAENPEQVEGDDLALSEEPPADQGMEPTPEPMAEASPMEEPPPPSVDESLAAGDSSMDAPMDAPIEEPKKIIPLRKIADTPYEQSGVVVNAVYLARKGDTLDNISTKIYGGTDKIKELVKLNPTFKSRDVKVGDKVYYSSPNRPGDMSRLLTYYEDNNLAPETYVVNEPENIRKIAKSLLGDSNSWKELWATNFDVESKGELAAGTQLRYWAAAPAMNMAESAPPAPDMAAPPMEAPPAQDLAQQEPPPPPMDSAPQPLDPSMNQSDLPPPPPMEAQAPPPPPPPSDIAPPPPPPAMAQVDGGDEGGGDQGPLALAGLEGDDQTMAMGAAAILLLGGIMIFIMVRKRRSRRQIDFHTSTQTQID